MNCPHCGATEPGPGAFCMRCGARLTPQAPMSALVPAPAVPKPAPTPAPYQPAPSQPAAVAPAPVSAPIQAVSVRQHDGVATVRHISAGSVFKVTFVTYLLLLGLMGLLVVVLPGLLGASLFGGLVDDSYNLGAFGGGIVGTLVIYVVLVIGGAIGPAIVMALTALIYNLVAGWVGGIRVRLQE